MTTIDQLRELTDRRNYNYNQISQHTGIKEDDVKQILNSHGIFIWDVSKYFEKRVLNQLCNGNDTIKGVAKYWGITPERVSEIIQKNILIIKEHVLHAINENESNVQNEAKKYGLPIPIIKDIVKNNLDEIKGSIIENIKNSNSQALAKKYGLLLPTIRKIMVENKDKLIDAIQSDHYIERMSIDDISNKYSLNKTEIKNICP